MSKKVYLLEDDASITELVKCSLELSGIDIVCFDTVTQFMANLAVEAPSVALLDIMLPDGNGLDVLKKIKQFHPSVICIMLSALGQEIDKVKGLNGGADDYIAKPFGVLELTARVNAALRRAKFEKVLVKDGLRLNEEDMTVTLDGDALDLNNKEFHLLKFLMSNEGKVVTREAILTAVWGYEEGETRTVDNHIARLRKLGIPHIETVFGVGYKFGGNK